MWILCNTNKAYDQQHFKDAAIALGIDLKIIDPTELAILNNGTITFYYQGNETKPPTYVLNWNGCMNSQLEEQIEIALSKCGTVICNSVSEINLWQDKFKWQLVTDLPVTKSLKIHSSRLVDSLALIESNFDYPLVLKSDTGSLGLGVYKAVSSDNLKQICEIISLLDKSFKVHIEQFINYTHDVRMYIIGDQYYLMERVATADFRANVAQNAEVQTFARSALTNSIFERIRSTYQAVVIGVDILLTEDGSYRICEINSAPGFTGIEQVNDVDIAYQILKAITAER